MPNFSRLRRAPPLRSPFQLKFGDPGPGPRSWRNEQFWSLKLVCPHSEIWRGVDSAPLHFSENNQQYVPRIKNEKQRENKILIISLWPKIFVFDLRLLPWGDFFAVSLLTFFILIGAAWFTFSQQWSDLCQSSFSHKNQRISCPTQSKSNLPLEYGLAFE